MSASEASAVLCSLAPLLRGEGRGEGLLPQILKLRYARWLPLTRIAEFIIGRRFAPTRWQSDLSPQARRGKDSFPAALHGKPLITRTSIGKPRRRRGVG